MYDILFDEWDCHERHQDQDKFLQSVWSQTGCCVFVDESGETVGQHNELMASLATRGRHWGHRVHFIAQRAAQVSPTVRDQCHTLFLFASSSKDSKAHAEEWNDALLLEAPNLKVGQCFVKSRFRPAKKVKIPFKKGR